MKIDFSWAKARRFVVVVIVRGNKDKILYNSGLTYLYHWNSVKLLKQEIEKNNPRSEFYFIDIYQAHAPEPSGSKGYYCPYCRQWEYWRVNTNGFRKCPICGISDQDQYIKKYNNLWTRGMGSKSQQKYGDKMRRVNNANNTGNGQHGEDNLSQQPTKGVRAGNSSVKRPSKKRRTNK